MCAAWQWWRRTTHTPVCVSVSNENCDNFICSVDSLIVDAQTQFQFYWCIRTYTACHTHTRSFVNVQKLIKLWILPLSNMWICHPIEIRKFRCRNKFSIYSLVLFEIPQQILAMSIAMRHSFIHLASITHHVMHFIVCTTRAWHSPPDVSCLAHYVTYWHQVFAVVCTQRDDSMNEWMNANDWRKWRTKYTFQVKIVNQKCSIRLLFSFSALCSSSTFYIALTHSPEHHTHATMHTSFACARFDASGICAQAFIATSRS